MKSMTLKTDLPDILTWDSFDRLGNIHHGFSTRSIAPGTAAWPFPPVHSGEQVHGALVAAVETAPGADSFLDSTQRIPGADAVVTRTPGVRLGVRTADCLPILLADPETGSLGAVHAGWRGTAKWIAKRTIETMASLYGTRPENIYAVLGPSIGACCYEVRADVVDAFNRMGHPIRDFITPKTADSWSLNLRGLNERQLSDSGVSLLHMSSVGECTACHPEMFPSYRRDGASENRIYSVIWRDA